jgi:hypothetical protein
VAGEVGRGSGEERRAGGAFLIGQDLGVGQSAVVVDQRMDVIEPELRSAISGEFSPRAAVGSPAAAVGNAPELLDVHVDQLSRPLAFVADRGRLAGPDHLSG